MGNSCRTRYNPQDSDHPPWLPPWSNEMQIDQADAQEGSRKRKRNASGAAGPPAKWSGWSWRWFRRQTQHEDESFDHHAPRPGPMDIYDYTRGPLHHVPSWDYERAASLQSQRDHVTASLQSCRMIHQEEEDNSRGGSR